MVAMKLDLVCSYGAVREPHSVMGDLHLNCRGLAQVLSQRPSPRPAQFLRKIFWPA
jgi:hypothetical protein